MTLDIKVQGKEMSGVATLWESAYVDLEDQNFRTETAFQKKDGTNGKQPSD